MARRALAVMLGALLAAATGVGCASSYYKTYKAENPHWVDTFPDRGASLHETLAGFTAPRRFDHQLMISKMDVLRLDESGARVLSEEEVDRAIAEASTDDFGIVANMRCTSQLDTKVYFGEKVGWALLVDGELQAWDVPQYGSRCVVANAFVPAKGDRAALEAIVVAHRDAKFPNSMEHVGEWYRKGLAYLGADRLEDAEEALARGDAIVDVGGAGRGPSVRGDGPGETPRTVGQYEIQQARILLVAGIDARKKALDVAAGSP